MKHCFIFETNFNFQFKPTNNIEEISAGEKGRNNFSNTANGNLINQ